MKYYSTDKNKINVT